MALSAIPRWSYNKFVVLHGYKFRLLCSHISRYPDIAVPHLIIAALVPDYTFNFVSTIRHKTAAKVRATQATVNLLSPSLCTS